MRLWQFLFVLVGLVFSIGSHAKPITFEDVPYDVSGAFTSGGFDFLLEGYASAVFEGQYCTPACPTNGTKMVIAPYGVVGNSSAPRGSLTMKKSDGGLFDFFGFDGGGSFNWNYFGFGDDVIPDAINVVGTKLGGAQVFQSFLIDKVSNIRGELNLVSYNASSDFRELESLYFSSSGSIWEYANGFTVDNIRPDISKVPEPGGVILFCLGALGLVIGRKGLKMKAFRFD